MYSDDGFIIQECLNGESEAFGVLVDKYKAGIYAFVYSKLGDFHDAQDVTQEIFLQAYRNLRNLRRWESFSSWLYRIAYSWCRRWIQSRARHSDVEFIEDQVPGTLEAASVKSYRENALNESLRVALDSLSDTYREVLILRYFGGMNSVEIAKALGTSPTAIRMRLSRARALLREEMVAMMNTAFEGQRLQISFTFRIVEAVRRIRIQPISPEEALPWGLSLAVGILIGFLSISMHLTWVEPPRAIPGSVIPSKSKILKVGEIPVDVIKTMSITPLSGNQGDGNEKALARMLEDDKANAEGVKIVPNDVKAGNHFGYEVCINGDYILACAPWHDGGKGAAYIFRQDGDAWREQAILTARDGVAEDYFGYSPIITDEYAIIAAPCDDDMGEDTGSVYIFRFDGNKWIEEGKLRPHGETIKKCYFGSSISISGDYLVIGSPQENWAGGAIYIFKCVDGKWEEQAKLISSDWTRFDNFGRSVSISGDYAIAGAPQHANAKGSAYIFKHTGEAWEEQAILVADDGEEGDYFGYSVSISGNYAVVGADWNKAKGEKSGSAYIFHNDSTSWKQQTKLISSDLASGDQFGRTVCISGNYALVSAYYKDGMAGAVYAFLRRGALWEERTKISLDRMPNWFGRSISISNNHAIVGAPAYSHNEGAVYIYDCITDLSLPVESKLHSPATQGGVKSGLRNNVNMPDVGAKSSIPSEFRLLQNFPNPFNPETWLPYELASDANVTIQIYDSGGGLVRELNLGMQEAGSYIAKDKAAYWDGRNEIGETVASDVYFYAMEAGGHKSVKKMILER